MPRPKRARRGPRRRSRTHARGVQAAEQEAGDGALEKRRRTPENRPPAQGPEAGAHSRRRSRRQRTRSIRSASGDDGQDPLNRRRWRPKVEMQASTVEDGAQVNGAVPAEINGAIPPRRPAGGSREAAERRDVRRGRLRALAQRPTRTRTDTKRRMTRMNRIWLLNRSSARSGGCQSRRLSRRLTTLTSAAWAGDCCRSPRRARPAAAAPQTSPTPAAAR